MRTSSSRWHAGLFAVLAACTSGEELGAPGEPDTPDTDNGADPSIGALAAGGDVPIVYIRCPRTTAYLDISGEVVINGVRQTKTRRMIGLDVYDVLPDVSNFFGGFVARCDLVYRDASGTETVLYDCGTTSTPEAACSAMDPAVSYDGKTVAFAVFRGGTRTVSEGVHAKVIDPAATNDEAFRQIYPNKQLVASEAQLYLVDTASGMLTELPHVPGTYDSGPAWLPNGRIAFTSTRDGRYRTVVPFTGSPNRTAQIWTMDPDGRNVDLVSQSGLGGEEHPFPLLDGRMAFSSWQGFGALPFRHTNGTPGGFTSLDNLFRIWVQNPDGSLPFAMYGQHQHPTKGMTAVGGSHITAHFMAQTSDGRIWVADYYRANNGALGNIYGFMPPPPGQEGKVDPSGPINDIYTPPDMIRLAPWSTNGDVFSKIAEPPAFTPPGWTDPIVYAGKLGHPAALPNNGLMVTWGKGGCSLVASNEIYTALGRPRPPYTSGNGLGAPMNSITSLGFDTPGCDAGIWRASVIPSAHPSDLVPIVDSRDYHEIMARAVVPYAELYGVDKPADIPRADLATQTPELPTGTPFALLGAASITDRETHPFGGIHFAGELQFSLQGTDTIDYTDEKLCGVRILGIMPNRSKDTQKEIHNLAGERVVLLGEVPVRKGTIGNEPLDPSGHADTSFLLRMPADMPYMMQGIDCEGRTLNTDQSWQHLRPGETKTCGGCHVHSKESRIQFEQSLAAAPDFEIAKLGEGSVPLLAGGEGPEVTTRTVPGYGIQIEFGRDIMPIFAEHCTQCHGGASPAGGLALDRPGFDAPADAPPSTWWCLVRDRHQKCVAAERLFNTGVGAGYTFRRPQVTKYIRAFNALGSLLYWKAAGKRTDGRTDDTFTSANEVYDRDIDFGPAHATTITPEQLGLLSRWIDLGAPVGTGELEDTQKPTLHLAAIVESESITELRVGTVDVPSGIDPASLVVCVVGTDGACGPNLATAAEMHGVAAIPAALSDPNVEVEARVKDLAGNETVVRRTVGWLVNSQQPVDPPEEPGSDQNTGCGCRSSTPPSGFAGLIGLCLLGLRRRRPSSGA